MSGAALKLMRGFFEQRGSSQYFDRLFKAVNVISVEPNKSMLCELKVEEKHCNGFGTVHGGFTASMVDMATTAVLLTTEKAHPGVSVDLSVNYVNPAKIGETVVFNSIITKAGRSIAFTKCEVTRKSDGAVVATAAHIKAFPALK